MLASNRGKKKKVGGKAEYREKYDNEIQACSTRYEHIKPSSLVKFSDLPLSGRTLSGLEASGFVNLTDIQRLAVPHCLRGNDVQAEAVTGSGKTLAFLVPLLETLWREKWSPGSGVGALVITPTRELAYQIYEVLKKIGCKHDFSAGLVIGGKSVEEEKRRISTTNIVIATPGRLLQHMDQTAGFNCDLLQVLVLDEADRTLDMGFATAMRYILENLPSDRQTLLFSATLSNPSIMKLANLSLQDSITVSTNTAGKTPSTLTHSFMELELQEKLEVLHAFIKSHLNSKILVFMSSCKQVQFHNAVLCKLRPGLPVLALYGKQKQLRRVGIYEAFCKKTAAVLLATDIAARGLDIPAVHWVVHLDCPEDIETYIHRSGRTARYHKAGSSLAMFLPSELEMVDKLSKQGISLTKIRVNPQKQISIQKKVQSLCAESPEIHHWSRKCFVSYVRSVFLQRDKSVFKIEALPLAAYAASLGLLTAPKVRFLKKSQKIMGADEENEKDGVQDSENEAEEKPNLLGDDDSDEDILIKSSTATLDSLSTEDLETILPRQPKGKAKTKVAKAKALLRKGIKANTKITFDEEGNVDTQEGVFEKDTSNVDITPSSDPAKAGGIDILETKEAMSKQDKADKEEAKQRRKDVKRMRKEKRKRNQATDEGVTLLQQDESDSDGDGIPTDVYNHEDLYEGASEDEYQSKRVRTEDLKLQDTEALAAHLLGDL